jgi:hypothetical protein
MLCVECKERERVFGRRYCRQCYLERKRLQAKLRYKEHGRYTYICTCSACGLVFKAFRKTQLFCEKCRVLGSHSESTTNRYVRVGVRHEHRILAEHMLMRKLSSRECVHHLDQDPKNNDPHNLIVMSRQSHGRLHVYLRAQRVILEKSRNENLENCWNSLIVPMTTTWLETANVKVIKLWEIGQSAAKPLPAVAYEEGSEAMHQTP